MIQPRQLSPRVPAFLRLPWLQHAQPQGPQHAAKKRQGDEQPIPPFLPAVRLRASPAEGEQLQQRHTPHGPHARRGEQQRLAQTVPQQGMKSLQARVAAGEDRGAKHQRRQQPAHRIRPVGRALVPAQPAGYHREKRHHQRPCQRRFRRNQIGNQRIGGQHTQVCVQAQVGQQQKRPVAPAALQPATAGPPPQKPQQQRGHGQKDRRLPCGLPQMVVAELNSPQKQLCGQLHGPQHPEGQPKPRVPLPLHGAGAVHLRPGLPGPANPRDHS